jgi:hypothetical protein
MTEIAEPSTAAASPTTTGPAPIAYDVDDFADLDATYALLHDRTYRVRAYRKSRDELLLRGRVRDQKPAGLYMPGDPEALTVHEMVIDLTVELPSLVITDAVAHMEVHPHDECPRVMDHYGNLIGLSIARGFTHRVRELFGGPRGCTHTTALLQAMAPVTIQSTWSMRVMAEVDSGTAVAAPRRMTPEERREGYRFNLNSCHVWDETGEFAQYALAGGELEPPVWAVKRMRELGRDPEEWIRQFRNE